MHNVQTFDASKALFIELNYMRNKSWITTKFVKVIATEVMLNSTVPVRTIDF
jgi:hypothetical protein